jgi:uncharacterized protein (DUF1778 family)
MARKQPSGAAKLKRDGRHAVLLGVTPEQHAKLKEAAAIELRAVSQFVVHRAVQAAEMVICRHERERKATHETV